MQVKHVDFLLTFKCTAECKHCSYKASPRREGYINPKDVSLYLKDLTQMTPLESVWVHGGEPFLYFKNLVKIIQEAKKWEVPHRGVITNSYWAKTEKKARTMLYKLKEAGLTAIAFSSDVFHQEFVPLNYVKNALKSAVDLGFDYINVDSYFIDDVTTSNIWNKITSDNLESLKEIKNVEFQNLIMSVEGRGINLKQYTKLEDDPPSGKCPVPFWIDGDLESPKTIEIDFEGNITLCPGICVGNTMNQSLQEIVRSYDVNKHPILSVIWNQGPIGLVKEAKTRGFQQDSKYFNECHLCYEMRKFLRPYYPNYLAPKSCY